MILDRSPGARGKSSGNILSAKPSSYMNRQTLSSCKRIPNTSAGAIVVTAITASISAVLIKGQLAHLKSEGYHPVLISSPGPEVEKLAADECIPLIPVYMKRDIGLLRDLRSLFTLIREIKKTRPDIVNAGTPKAGLLCMLAAWICRVPVRIYTLRGFRHESATPMLKWVLISIESLVCRLAHKVICISPSVLSLGLNERIIPKDKGVVLGSGSSNGIDLKRFSAERFTCSDRDVLRKQLGINKDDLVVGYVGRLIPRKGITELVQAWQVVHAQYPATKLLIVGPYEDDQPLPPETISAIRSDRSIITTGLVSDVERYFLSMDIFALPAHWEGFGNVLIQAAAMGLPIVTTNVTGACDAVKADYNATLIPPQDVDALVAGIVRYIEDKNIRQKHGEAGPEWVRRNFDQGQVWEALCSFYENCLRKRPL